jgi:hypothetical protein
MDEVRKVIKTCYEEVWTILQEHRCAAVQQAGIVGRVCNTPVQHLRDSLLCAVSGVAMTHSLMQWFGVTCCVAAYRWLAVRLGL